VAPGRTAKDSILALDPLEKTQTDFKVEGLAMFIKKANGNIFGAVLTAAEQKAMNIEIQKGLAEYDKKHALEIDAIILWELRNQLGFGPKRLKRFYKNFSLALANLTKRYELEDQDNVWICTQKLKEYGIDVEEWDKERCSNAK